MQQACTQTKCIFSHYVLLFQSCHHDDYPDVLLPHHPPEVSHGVVQWTLSADEVSFCSSTLNTDTHIVINKQRQTHRQTELSVKLRKSMSSYRHIICIDVVSVWMGVLDG